MPSKCTALFLVLIVGQFASFECKPQRSSYTGNSKSGCRGSYSPEYDYEQEQPISGRIAASRHVFTKGKYPVILKPPVPAIERRIPVTTTHITTPVQEKPIIHLPANIPKPRTISHTCTCYQTILTPRIEEKIITVPTFQRYLETTQAPVIENIQFPCYKHQQSSDSQLTLTSLNGRLCSGAAGIQVPEISALEFPTVQYPSASQVQLIEIPQVQSFQVPRGQTYESSCYSSC